MPPCCMISGRHSWLLAMAARRFTPSVMSSTVPASVARVSAAERMALRIAGMPWAWYLGWDKKRIDTNSKVIQASSRFPRSGCFCDYRFTMIYPWKKQKINSAAHQDTAQTGWRCCWHTTLPGTSVPVPGHGDFPRAPAWRWEVSGWCRPPPGHPCSRHASPIHWSYLGSSHHRTEGFFLGDWKSKHRFCPETGGFPCIPQDCNLGVHYFWTNPFQNIKTFKSHKILSALMATCGSPEWYCRVFFTAETPPASMICAPFSGMYAKGDKADKA